MFDQRHGVREMVLLSLLLMLGCDPIPDGSGRLAMRVQNVQEEDDVGGFLFQVWSPEFTELIASSYAPLEEEALPTGYFSTSGAHLFSDTYFQLLVGQYDVFVQPMKSEAEVSESCHAGISRGVDVVDGKTKEIQVVCDCISMDTGGMDVMAVLNHGPYFPEGTESIVYDPGKNIHTCEPLTLQATAVDPDNDALEYTWELEPASEKALFYAEPIDNVLHFISYTKYGEGGTGSPAYWATVTVCDDMPQPLCDSQELYIHVPWNSDANKDGIGDACAMDCKTWYHDKDGDTFGDPGDSMILCAPAGRENPPPEGWVKNNRDCNDDDAKVNPNAIEICNTFDDDCDSLIDDDDPSTVGQPIWYRDEDGDGYGNPNVNTRSCNQPPGYVNNPDDCDSNISSIHPGAPELCNCSDDDCDSAIDEGCIEVCNRADDDCNGLVDDADPSVTGQTWWYRDADGDGYPTKTDSWLACFPPPGYMPPRSDNKWDCRDDAYAIHPDAQEICDREDNDCDLLVDDADDSVAGQQLWYLDGDGDSYPIGGNAQKACYCPPGYREPRGDGLWDCNDSNPSIHPGANEVPANSTDENCDGKEACYLDADKDWFGTEAGTIVLTTDLACNSHDASNRGTGISPNKGDCNDNLFFIRPDSHFADNFYESNSSYYEDCSSWNADCSAGHTDGEGGNEPSGGWCNWDYSSPKAHMNCGVLLYDDTYPDESHTKPQMYAEFKSLYTSGTETSISCSSFGNGGEEIRYCWDGRAGWGCRGGGNAYPSRPGECLDAGGKPQGYPFYFGSKDGNNTECTTPLVLVFSAMDKVGFLPSTHGFRLAPQDPTHPVALSWPAATTPWVVFDRNFNGFIDDGSELFGSAFLLSDGALARNGFQALAELDRNQDGRIDAEDPEWSELQAWRDENGDGFSQPQELTSLEENGLAELSLDYVDVPHCDEQGNCERERAGLRFLDSNGRVQEGALVDVYLRVGTPMPLENTRH